MSSDSSDESDASPGDGAAGSSRREKGEKVLPSFTSFELCVYYVGVYSNEEVHEVGSLSKEAQETESKVYQGSEGPNYPIS